MQLSSIECKPSKLLLSQQLNRKLNMTTHAEELGMLNKNVNILKLQCSFNCLVDLAADNIESI